MSDDPEGVQARARAVLRRIGVEAAPRMQSTRDGTCLFRAGDHAVKVWPQTESDRAARQIARQQAVALAMRDAAYRVPPVVAQGDGVLVMDWIEGTPLAALCREGEEDIAARHAGMWLRAFHGLSLRDAPFRPKGHVNWLDRLVAAGHDGTRHIPDLAGFEAAARDVQAMAPKVRGLPTRKAVTHRDMTLSNLMWDGAKDGASNGAKDGATVWGLDFENDREDEPLRDVFTVLLDLWTLAGASEPVAKTLRDAYGDTESATDVRLFLQRCFALWVWANTPARPSRRHSARLVVAHRLLTDAQPSI